MAGIDVIGLFVLIIIFPFLPQIVGFISYLLLKPHDDLFAHMTGVIIPPLSAFFLFQWLVPHTISSSLGKRGVLVIFGLLLQLFFSLLIQLATHNRHKFNEGQLP